MYAYLRGKVAVKTSHYIVIDVGGVGYKVFTSQRVMSELPLEQEATVYTYLNVREDDLSLYGFGQPETLSLFELLLTVSGVGPKLALAIVNAATSSVIYQAILSDDITILTKIPGVGKKTAQRLVLELKEKIKSLGPEAADGVVTEFIPGSDNGVHAQVLAALTSLGYRNEEAQGAMRFALQRVPEKVGRVDDLLRETLKFLASNTR